MHARRTPCAYLYRHERGAAMSDKERPCREEVRLLNIKEAARFLGTTDKTLYTKIWRREIPFIKIGRSVRFDVRDLEALIERSRVRAEEF
jgi:excisionase family DNA binding protein